MDDKRAEAERVFAEYIGRLESGEQPDFDALAAEHPDLADELRALQDAWERVQSLLGDMQPRPLSERLQQRLGTNVPDVSLEPEGRGPDSSFSSDVLKRLSGRTGAFGRYRLKGEVAHGGQGAIVRVWDEDLRRHLVMKVVLGQARASSESPLGMPSVDERTLGRFLEEAQVTGQLDHPGIVPVHELGLDDQGRIYFTMKLVKGRDLRQIYELIHEGKEGWNRTRALGVLLKVCEAMSYAHAKGVIHRDLKPANVMVGQFGEVYVMDWGLARVLGREDEKNIRIRPAPSTTSEVQSDRKDRGEDSPDSPLVTMDGDVVGTPAFMPPEQAAGDLERMGPHSDVYSVGAMLYHLLTGQVPYVEPGVTVSPRTVLGMVLHRPPRPVHEIAPDTPAELVAICDMAMSREIAERFPDMAALGDDLRAFLENRVVSAFETGSIAELRKWVRRNQLVAGIAVVSFVLIATLGGLHVGSLGRSLGRETELRLLAERRNHGMRLQHAAGLIDGGRNGEAASQLEECSPELRGFVWHHLMLRTNLSEGCLESGGGYAPEAAFSADGRFAIIPQGRTARIVDTSSGEEEGLQGPDAQQVRSVAISGDGATIALGGLAGRVDVRNRETGETQHSLTIGERVVNELALDATGSTLVARVQLGAIEVYHIPSGRRAAQVPTVRPRSERAGGLPVALSSDGRWVAYLTHGLEVMLWDWRAEEAPRRLDVGWSLSPSAIAFDEGEDSLVIGGREQLAGWSLQGSKILWTRPIDVSRPEALAIFPGQGILAAGGQQLFVSGGRSRTLRAPQARIVAVHAEGETIRCVDSEGSLFTLSAGTNDGFWFVQGFVWIHSTAFDPSGRWLAVGGHRSPAADSSMARALLFDSNSGEPTAVLPGGCVAFSPDGRRVAVGASIHATTLSVMESAHLASDAIVVCALDGTQQRRLRAAPWGVNDLAWSPDGTRIAAATGAVRTDDGAEVLGGAMSTDPDYRNRDGYEVMDARVLLFDASDGRLLAESSVHAEPVTAVAFDPTGRTLYTGGADGDVHAFSARDGSHIRVVLDGEVDAITHLVVHPERSELLLALSSGVVKLMDLDTGATSFEVAHETWVDAVAFSPDGSQIATTARSRLFFWTLDGDLMYETRGGDSLAYSPDGRRVASGGYVHESELSTALGPWRGTPRMSRLEQRVKDAFRRQMCRADALAELSRDDTLTDEDREVAEWLAQVPGGFRPPDALVASLFDRTAGEAHRSAAITLRCLVAEASWSAENLMLLCLAEIRLDRHEAAVAVLDELQEYSDAMRRATGQESAGAALDILRALSLAKQGQHEAAAALTAPASQAVETRGGQGTWGPLLDEIAALCGSAGK